MDFRPGQANKGGSDGCMHFDDPDNKGIPSCVKKFGIDKLYAKFSSKVSLADFLVIIAEAAIGRVGTEPAQMGQHRAPRSATAASRAAVRSSRCVALCVRRVQSFAELLGGHLRLLVRLRRAL